MTFRVSAFFQNMPPFSGATAMRGHSVMASLAKVLSQHDSKVAVYTTTANATPIAGVEMVILDAPEVDNSLSLKRRLVSEIRVGYAAAKRMFIRKAKPDLALISSPGYIPALVLSLVARWRGIPYVLELRDIYPQVYAEASLLGRKSLLFRLLQILSSGMYGKAELVVCATQGLAREVQHEANQARVTYVYNGFPASLATRGAQKHDRFTVCFHGVLGFFQDIETLVEVARRLAAHDTDVLAIGYGRKAALLENNSTPNLRFLGRLPFDRTIAEIERCHLGLCLRLDDAISKDAFPVKVWEYLGLGIPCIVTPPCEAGDFLKGNDCGVVLDAGDVAGIVAAVLKARTDARHIEAMAANCRRLAGQYTREQTGLAVAKEVRSVLERCSPASSAAFPS